MDWKKCVLYEKETKTLLLNLLNNNDSNICGYSKLIENIHIF